MPPRFGPPMQPGMMPQGPGAMMPQPGAPTSMPPAMAAMMRGSGPGASVSLPPRPTLPLGPGERAGALRRRAGLR